MTKVNLFHEDSTFNAIASFPEAPQIGDKVDILTFLKDTVEDREHVKKYFYENDHDTTVTVKNRIWQYDRDNVVLAIELHSEKYSYR